jgi:hypothetical protein
VNPRIAPNLTTCFPRKRVRFGEMGFVLINKQRGEKKDIKQSMLRHKELSENLVTISA